MTSTTTEQIEEACGRALRVNLGLRPGERFLVVTDASKLPIGRAFEAAARKLTDRVELLEIPVGEVNGAEPPEEAAQRMLQADVLVMPLAQSLSWTRARRAATEQGARIASMARITEDMILRTFGIDYEPIRARVNRLCDLLDAGRHVRIETAAGTALELGIEGRAAHGRSGGIYREPGQWGNLPCGEAFIAPVEGTAEGVYVVDAAQAGVGQVTSPIRITVEQGRATAIEGEEEAEELAELLASVDSPQAYNIAELGIGCNPGARVSGIILEDEKVLGTCHIALGNNALFGGTIDVPVHVDGVMRDPSLWLDGAPVLRAGQLVLDA